MSNTNESCRLSARWREGLEGLASAQAEMLRWYRDVHEPAAQAGNILNVEAGFDDRNQAVQDARERLMLVQAPNLNALMVKFENNLWIADCVGDEIAKAIARQQCADLVLLAMTMGIELRTASIHRHVGPNYTEASLRF